MAQIIELLKQVGVFMVCAQTILHFKPKQKYDKYLKLLVGIMVIAQLATPFLSLFSKKDKPMDMAAEFYMEFADIKLNVGEGEFDIDQMLGNADSILNKYMDAEVKSRLNNEQKGAEQ